MDVSLTPPEWATHLLSDLHDWSRSPLPVAELRPFSLPDDVYFEYAWLDAAGEPRPDPDNKDRRNPWWPHACALVGPRYRPNSLADGPALTSGSATRRYWLESKDGSRRHRVLVHSPDSDFTTPRPTIYLQDDKAYFGWGRLPRIAAALEQAGKIPSARYVCVQPVDRGRDYFFNADFRRFMVEELIPAVEGRAPCDGVRFAMGASLGGLCSAWIACLHPTLFAGVASQSGAFLMGPDDSLPDPFGGSQWFQAMIASAEAPRLRWYLDCGRLEWLYAAHLKIRDALAEGGYDHRVESRSAGHNWINWRDGIPGALKFLLAG